LGHILRHNKTMIALDLSGNIFGQTTGAVECIADGLGSNSMLLKIDLSQVYLGTCRHLHSGASKSWIDATETHSRQNKSITVMGVGVLLETMGQSHPRITELELEQNSIGNEGAGLLARSLGNNALPNLACLSLSFLLLYWR
jgi:Ran GTPase-activating protein (RanGAP) involved in mRNA processing and transport